MKFKKEVLEQIDNRKLEILRTKYKRNYGMGLEIHDARLVINGMSICNVDEIKQLLANVAALHEAIADVTGIEF